MSSGAIPPNISGISKVLDSHKVAQTTKKAAAIGVALAIIVTIGAVLAVFLVPGGGLLFGGIAIGAGVTTLGLLGLFLKQLHSEKEAKSAIEKAVKDLSTDDWKGLDALTAKRLAPLLTNASLNTAIDAHKEKIEEIENGAISAAKNDPAMQRNLAKIIKEPVEKVDVGDETRQQLVEADNVFYILVNEFAKLSNTSMDDGLFKFSIFGNNSSQYIQYRYSHREGLEKARRTDA